MTRGLVARRRARTAGGVAAVVMVATATAVTSASAAALKHAPVRSAVEPDGIGVGPAGGYTPDDLAVAYGFNPAVPRSNQTVAVISWYDDPTIAANLASFDTNYGLAAETAASFRKVNQDGTTSPLPSSSNGKQTAGEISLGVESVRGVCHTCRILLVEATNAGDGNLAAAEDTAVRLGATEVANLFGSPEGTVPARDRTAFNHPGVVITAPAGNDGWYGWDLANDASGHSEDAPDFPASDPAVIAVGGTTLLLNADASRNDETTWNANGEDDQQGLADGRADGATGGGCSQLFASPSWQAPLAGYSAAACNGKRLAADVAADADPATGFDAFDTWGTGDTGWVTMGGTSLAASIVAGMYALAGGSGGATYPAASAYERASITPNLRFDVTEGGNGFCGGDTTLNCGTAAESIGGTHNPNALGGGEIDCSFPRDNSDPVSPPPQSTECNAGSGFDGASGIGTPTSAGLFASTSPAVSLRRPAVVHFRKPTTFNASAVERLAGQHSTTVTFLWGDSKSSSGSRLSQAHSYTRPGSYTVSVVVTDSAAQQSIATTAITVGKRLSVKVSGPKSVKHSHKAKFSATSTDPNTGGKVTSFRWNWGDGTTGTGRNASHTWHKAGRDKITLTVRDNTGVMTKQIKKIRIR